MKGFVIAVTMMIVVSAGTRARAEVDPAANCLAMATSGGADQAAAACDAALEAMRGDIVRTKHILASSPPQSRHDEAYALSRGVLAVEVFYAQAKIGQKLGDAQRRHRFAQDTAVYALNLHAMLIGNDRTHAGPLFAQYNGIVNNFMSAIDQIEPGIVEGALAAARTVH